MAPTPFIHARLTPADDWSADTSGASTIAIIIPLVVIVIMCVVCVACCVRQEKALLKREKRALEGHEVLDDEEEEEEERTEMADTQRSVRRSEGRREAAPSGLPVHDVDPAPPQHDVEVPAAQQQAVEYRVDPADGEYYKLQSFLDEYGDDEGMARWNEAAHTARFDADYE